MSRQIMHHVHPAAKAAVLLAVLLLSSTTIRLVVVERLPAVVPTRGNQRSDPKPKRQFEIQLAVDRNLFTPDRAPIEAPNTLTQPQIDVAQPQAPRAVPNFRLLGTVLSGSNTGLAVVEVPGRGGVMVRVGDMLTDYRVAAIRKNEVRLATSDTMLTLRLPGSERGIVHANNSVHQ